MSLINAFLFASLLALAYHLAKVIIKRRIQTNNQIGDKTRAKLKENLWKIFSRYIRLKDADWKAFTNCFTCGKYEDFRLVDAGHYLPKAGNSDALYFSELNVHVQCVNCNRLLDGNVKVYKERLIAKYGPQIIQQLNTLRTAPPFTTQDYKQMIDKYAILLKELK